MWIYTCYTHVEVYVVYACGGVRGIRMWRCTWYTHDVGIRDIRMMEVYVVYACEGVRGIHMMEVYVIYA